MKVRLITLSIVTALAGALALAAPMSASAHGLDALHQHGFTDTYLLFNNPFKGTPERCGSSSPWAGYPTGPVHVFLPDLVTTPGETRRVFVTAKLEYWAGAGWQEHGDWKPWAYTWANSTAYSGRMWYDWSTGRQLFPPSFQWDVPAGYYRIHFYFFWQYDGTTHDHWTDWCEVA